MKIAMIVAELPYPSNSGGRVYTWNRIKELNRLGHEILLYAFKEKDEILEKDELLKYCSEVNIYNRNKSLMNVLKNFLKPYSAITRYDENLKKKISDESTIDLIIVDMPQLIYNLPIYKKKPIVLTQHNIEYKSFASIANKSKSFFKKINFYLESIKLYILEKNIYKKSFIDLYTFISLKDKMFFEEKFRIKNTILVPFGYNTIEKNIYRKNKKRIVFTGKMDYEPNREAVLWFSTNIWPYIKQKIENVEFYIVGKSPSNDIINLKAEDIIVTGTVESVDDYIDSADLIVIPLLSGGGVKIKLIEALGRDNIVISTSKGVEGTIFENNKHLLIEDNSKEFAKKCIEVLRNTNNFRHLPQNAIKIIEKEYSWKAISKNYEDSLYKLIKK